LDIIGYRYKGTKGQSSAIISIKTGYSIGGNNAGRLSLSLDYPFTSVKSTPKNHNQLQSLGEYMILKEEYDLRFPQYFILYLENDIKDCTYEPPADWWANDVKAQRTFYEVLCSNVDVLIKEVNTNGMTNTMSSCILATNNNNN
jgi:hypothetical protein